MQPNEFLKTWRESGREALAASMAPETLNAEQRTVDVVWFTGVDVPRYDWWTGASYVLRFDPKGVDLSLLNNGAPVLDNHSSWEGAAGQKGKVEKAWVEDSLYKGTLRFSKRSEVDGLWTDIQDKIVTKFSMGVEILESIEKRNKDGNLEMRTATKWRPFELSVAPIPADFGTTTLSAEGSATDVSQRASAQLNKEEVPTMPEQIKPTGTEARTDEAALAAAREEGARLERERAQKETERLSAIDAASVTGLKEGYIDSAFVEQFKREGKTTDQFKAAAWEKLVARTDANPTRPTNAAATITADGRDKRREAMTAALFNRYDGRAKLEGEAREYRGMSLLRMAEECLSNAGVKTRGMAPMELATTALTFGQQFVGVGVDGIEQLGAMSTSDFPYILANVANKTLRAAYEAQPSRWKEFSRRSNARDFKAKYINQLGDAPTLDLVPESGEFTTGSIPEAQESYRIYTYGKILPFTRQSLINDDMGAFTRLQELQGRSAARKEADLVWALITSNPTMGDGAALFHATLPTAQPHANLTSVGTVINVDNLGIARQKMRIQKGLGSTEYLNLEARFLLVPTTKEQLAIQYTSVNYTPMATSTTASGINPWAGTLVPITEARLDSNSITAWYVVADPAQIDTIEFAYLEGQEGVYLESRMGFNVDGMEFKCRIDFGAKVIDWRAFVKNVGA